MNGTGWTLVATGLLGAALLGSLAGPVALADSDGATLQTRVDELEAVVKAQQEQIDELGKALAAVQRTADGVVAGAKSLAAAADSSRDHGFESAGPNPKAKTELLDGLMRFASSVEKSRAEPVRK